MSCLRDEARGAAPPSIAASIAACGGVWLLLVCVQRLWPGDAGDALSFGLAAGATYLIPLSERATRPGRQSPSRPRRWATFAAWILAGLCAQPWLAMLASQAFLLLDAEGVTWRHEASPALIRIIALCVCAPVFEERLYRGHVFAAIHAIPVPHASALAVIGSSLCFALPHIEPLRVLATFLAGLVLGSARCATGRIAPGLAMHVGMNLASTWPAHVA